MIERMVDLAAAELGIDPVELRRRNMIPPEAMPFKTGLIFTYDCGEFDKNLDMALELADFAGFEQRRAESRSARQTARHRHLEHDRARRGRRLRGAPKSASTAAARVTLLSGSITQGMGHETVYKQLLCDRLGIHPDQVTYVQGDTDKVAIGEGTGGSRSAALGGSAVHAGDREDRRQGQDDRRPHARSSRGRHRVRGRRRSAIAGTDRKLTLPDIAAEALEPAEPADRYGAGPCRGRRLCRQGRRISRTACHVCEFEIDPETGEVEILRYTVVDDVGTVMNPLLLEGQIIGGIAQGVGQLLMEDIRFDPETGQLLTGSFMDYAMPRAGDFCRDPLRQQPGADQDQPARRQGRRRGRRGRRDAGGRQRADRRAVAARDPRHRNARHPGTPLARHSPYQRVIFMAGVLTFRSPRILHSKSEQTDAAAWPFLAGRGKNEREE